MYIIYENCCNTAMTSVTDPVLKVNGASQVIWVRIMLVGPIIREVLLHLTGSMFRNHNILTKFELSERTDQPGCCQEIALKGLQYSPAKKNPSKDH